MMDNHLLVAMISLGVPVVASVVVAALAVAYALIMGRGEQ